VSSGIDVMPLKLLVDLIIMISRPPASAAAVLLLARSSATIGL